MKIFLKLKGWQLFFLVIGLFIISNFVLRIPPTHSIQFYAYFLFTILGHLIFLGWDWSVGLNLNRIVPGKLRMPTMLFKCVIFAKAVLMIINMIKSIWFPIYNEPINPLLYILFVASISFSFYIIFFEAKNLSLAEKQQPVVFKDYARNCVGLFFWIVCILTIQERINRLFGYGNEIREKVMNNNEIPNQEAAADSAPPRNQS
jgi:hypothetical protein